MYELVGRMTPGPLDVVDWDRTTMVWNGGWGHGANSRELEPFRAEVVRQLRQPVNALAIFAIRPMGAIHPHEDGLVHNAHRYHFVLRTNDWCWSYHDGDWQQLEAGGIYVMNANLTHASVNLGKTTRYHLVADAG